MPSKRDVMPMSPALKYLLMIGVQSSARLPGWVALAQMRHGDLERHAETVWHAHGASLARMATAAGFTPWMAGNKIPRGPAVDAWRKAFVDAHRY